MKKIYKYQIGHQEQLDSNSWVRLPLDAKILSIQEQNGILIPWAEVNPANKEWPRKIAIVGTGFAFNPPEDSIYISTIQSRNGLAFHFHDYGDV